MWPALIRDWHAEGIPTLFDFGPESDMKNASMVIAYATQGGLGMPDRDYYLREDAKSKALLAKYQAHVAHMLGLVAQKNADAQAGWVLDLETRLAKASLDPVALREPENSYHIFTVKDADAKTPHFPWTTFYGAIGHAEVDRFSLAQPDFFAAADKALAEVPVAHWQAYLRWHLVDFAAPFLERRLRRTPISISTARTLARHRTAQAALETRDRRDQRGARLRVGEAYVARTFPPEAKQRAEKLVADLKTALRARIARLDWMADATKKSAYAKLDTLRPKIGYPDKWRDYSELKIGAFRTSTTCSRPSASRRIASSPSSASRSTATNGACCRRPSTRTTTRCRTRSCFRPRSCSRPISTPSADDALNYGGIGAVIGHEMLHGFDDQGSQFDAQGNLARLVDRRTTASSSMRAPRNWSSSSTHYVPIDDLHINGKLTLGENIADLGGLAGRLGRVQARDAQSADEKIATASRPNSAFSSPSRRAGALQQRPEATAPAGAIERARAGEVPRQRPGQQRARVRQRIRLRPAKPWRGRRISAS